MLSEAPSASEKSVDAFVFLRFGIRLVKRHLGFTLSLAGESSLSEERVSASNALPGRYCVRPSRCAGG